MAKFSPKQKIIEVLASDNYNVSRISANDADIVEQTLKRATVAFDLRIEEKSGTNGSDVFLSKRNSSNMPVGIRGDILLGYYLTSVFRSDCKGRYLSDWIISDNNTPKDTWNDYYSIETGVIQEDKVSKTSNFDVWKASVAMDITEIIEAYASPNTTNADISERAIKVKKFRDEFLGLIFLKNDERFASYLIQVLQNFVKYYEQIFLPTASENRFKYHDTKRFNSFSLLRDNESFLSAVSDWVLSERTISNISHLAELYKIDFEKVYLDNGNIIVPRNFYDSILNYAIHGSELQTSEMQKFQLQMDDFKQKVERLVGLFYVFRSENTPLQLPSWIQMFAHSNLEVRGDIEDMQKEWEFIKSTDALAISKIQDFINTFFVETPDDESWLPSVVMRSTIINGIPSLYYFRFNDPTHLPYYGFKISSEGTDKDPNITWVAQYDVKEGMNKIFKDSYEDPVYTKECEKGGYYGSDQVSENFKLFLISSLREMRVYRNSINSWDCQIDDKIFTIKPPKQTVRKLDIYNGCDLRCVDSESYERIEVDVSNDTKIKELSMLDAFFCFRRQDTTEFDKLGFLYEKRLNRLSSPGNELKPIELAKMPTYDFRTPNYGTLLSIGGASVISDFASRVHKLRINGINEQNIVKAAKSPLISEQRYIEVSIPISKSAVNKRLFIGAPNRKVLYESSETRNSLPYFQLINRPFSPKLFKDHITGTFNLDLANDVKFNDVLRRDVLDSKIVLNKKAILGGLEDINAYFDEKYAIVDSNGKPAKFGDLFSTRLQGHSVLDTWLNCVRDSFGRWLYGDETSDILDICNRNIKLVDWIEKNFSIEDSDTLSSIEGSYSSALFGSLRETKNYTPEALPAFYKTIFGDDAPLEQSIPDSYVDIETDAKSYTSILDDCLNNRTKFPRPQDAISVVSCRVPGSIIKDPKYLSSILQLIINNKYSSALRNL